MNIKISKLILLIVTLLVVSSMFIIGCASTPTSNTTPPVTQKPAGPTYGGILVVSDIYDGASIGYPAKLNRIYSQREVAGCIETLLRFDSKGVIIPWLATEWKLDAATKSITLSLRKGVKFHDGSDFNAAVCKWNLDTCREAKLAGTQKMVSVDIVDDYTIRINLTEWDNTIIGYLADTPGMMISQKACLANGVPWSEVNPVGTGPFKFVSWQKEVKAKFAKNPDYWIKGKPYLDGFEFITILDQQTRLMSFQNGEAHIALSIDAMNVQKLHDQGLEVRYRTAGSGTPGAVFSGGNPASPFADVRVRRAAQYAIDAQQIAKVVVAGLMKPSNQWVAEGHWGFNTSVKGYPYDPAKAKQLLTEANLANGFQTKITYRAGGVADLTFQAVQGFFKTVGINAVLDPVQTNLYDQIAMRGGTWDGLMHNASSPNPDPIVSLTSRYAKRDNMSFISGLYPADYLAAIDKAQTAIEFTDKQKFTWEVQRLLVDEYCLQLFTYTGVDVAAVSKKVKNDGYLVTPHTGWSTPEEAWLDTK